MAQYSLKAYDADIWILEFKGIGPAGDHIGDDMRYAAEAINVETPEGVLQPTAEPLKDQYERSRTGTDATIYRFRSVRKSNDYNPSAGTVFVVCTNDGAFYDGNSIYAINKPSEYASAINTNDWQFCPAEYEYKRIGGGLITPGEDPPVYEGTEDAILCVKTEGSDIYTLCYGNAYNPSVLFWGHENGLSEGEKEGAKITTPVPFRCLERYKERFWACGGTGANDAIYYSKPYDYTDWDDASVDIPEDGAGMIMIPTWDGDTFTYIKTLGDSLIFFKRESIFKLTGSDPSNFVITRQYGPGTGFMNTIVVNNTQMLFAREDGIYVFDGMESRQILKDITDNIKWRETFKTCVGACLCQNRYIIIGKSSANKYTMLTYDLDNGTVLLRDAPETFAVERYSPYIVMRDPADSTKVVYRQLVFNSWEDSRELSTITAATKWVSPWIDFDYQTIRKGGFEVHFTPEVKGYPVTFKLSIETEKKIKTKRVTIQPTGSAPGKQKRVRFGGAGRRFRLIIETDVGNKSQWRLVGGVHIVAEIDRD